MQTTFEIRFFLFLNAKRPARLNIKVAERIYLRTITEISTTPYAILPIITCTIAYISHRF